MAIGLKVARVLAEVEAKQVSKSKSKSRSRSRSSNASGRTEDGDMFMLKIAGCMCG